MKETVISGELTIRGLRLRHVVVKASFTAIEEHAVELIKNGKVKVADSVVLDPELIIRSDESIWIDVNATRKLVKVVVEVPQRTRRGRF